MLGKAKAPPPPTAPGEMNLLHTDKEKTITQIWKKLVLHHYNTCKPLCGISGRQGEKPFAQISPTTNVRNVLPRPQENIS